MKIISICVAAMMFSSLLHASPPEITSGSSYILLGGGLYDGDFYTEFQRHNQVGLIEQASFNDKYHAGYAQIGVGKDFHFSNFNLSQEIVLKKLFGEKKLRTSSTTILNFRQNFDIGYDLLPKMELGNLFEVFAIAGLHYGQFNYGKKSLTSTAFNIDAHQFGYNLGAGLRYKINPKCAVDFRYQHLQYSHFSAQATHRNGSQLTIDNNRYSPSFDLFGLQIEYYI